MKALDPNAEFRRILVVCTRQIGDVLLTTPLIRAAKRRWPAAAIDVLGFAGTTGMLKGNPDVAEIIDVPPGSGWWQSLPLVRRLWRHYDLALITERSDRAHLYGWFAARLRAGRVTAHTNLLGRWKPWLLRHAVTVEHDDEHVALERLRLLDPWIKPSARDAVHVVPPPAAPLPRDVTAALTHPYAVVHVPSMWHYKQWPLDRYQTLVRGLLDDGVQVVLTGGPADTDVAKCAEVASVAAPPALLDLAGRLNFTQLTTLLQGAGVYVGPDTSVTHLAAACGIPVVALYGPTNPQLWGPWPQGHAALAPYHCRGPLQHVGLIRVVQSERACVPCMGEGCDRHRNSASLCLEQDIDAQHVIAQTRKALGLPPQTAVLRRVQSR